MRDPQTGTAAATVLVVDDDADIRDLLRFALSPAGYDVRVAADGALALQALRSEAPPDVVLLDVMMPGVDGWQVLEAVRDDARFVDLPVVLLTALTDERDRIRGRLSGAMRYVTKPFDLRGLLGTLEQVLAVPDEDERAARRAELHGLLQRLAELEAGRGRPGDRVRWSRLEAVPRPAHRPTAVTDQLTGPQVQVAAMLAAGASVTEIAERRGTSRSSIYAVRQRIARVLGVRPDAVADACRRAGLGPKERQDS